MKTLSEKYRTNRCGELRLADDGKNVRLAGWVQNWRDHGGLVFIDLRDRTGITQIVFDPDVDKEMFDTAGSLRCEYVVSVEGTVRPRLEGNANLKLDTGEIEVLVSSLDVLNVSDTPPFEPTDYGSIGENTRLKYRYIDIRRPQMQEAILMRHKAMQAARSYLNSQDFLEVETPILTKSTPEGARDYLVPSRVNAGTFYALPQSPQMFKQLLMVGGVDRYYQICRCFRDEDLRHDRQPEFTQIDVEMSFVEKEDIYAVTEGIMGTIFRECAGIGIETPFPRMSYAEAMDRYGTDKPDTRFGMELKELSDTVKQGCEFKVFLSVLESGGTIKGISVPGGAELTRKEIDNLTDYISEFGAKGLAWMKMQEGTLQSTIAKFFSEDVLKSFVDIFNISDGDILLIVADKPDIANASLDALRRKLAKERNLIPEGKHNFLWVEDFPLFHYDEAESRYDSEHHPFTGIMEEDFELLDTDPAKTRSLSYDAVLNGYEILSGSIRIHRSDIQQKIFRLLNISEEEIKRRFGFFVDALKFGTPPHGGFALGFDRIIMLLLGTENIRDVIVFPKTQKAACLMSGAPSGVDGVQLRDLHIESTVQSE